MPSYKSGFYAPTRRFGVPKYPELWDGCVGAWCASLGQTGYLLKDMSGYNNNGYAQNMTPDSIWKIYGKDYSANFTGAYYEYITCGSSSLLAFNTNDTFSGSAWIYPTANPLFGYILGIRNGGTFRYTLRISSGALSLLVSSGGAVNGGSISINRWSHVGFIYSNGSIRLFINGNEVTSASGRSISTSITEFTIGNDLGLTQPFYGGLDDIRMYSRGLSQNEFYVLSRRRGISYEFESNKSFLFLSSTPQSRKYSTLIPRIIGVE